MGAATGSDAMRGLGAGDGGGLPRLTARGAGQAAIAPASTKDSALQERTAASAAPGVAPAGAPASAVRPDDEDYNYTYLSPAKHTYELPDRKAPPSRDWRYLAELGLQGSAALAVVYLFLHSDVGYLLGMKRRRKKTGGES
ncbi:MAG: hypothetical protein ACHQ49_12350 [Elusimicrobiota bacterium]